MCWCDYIHTPCVQCSCIPPVHCITCADKVQSACCCLMSTLQCVLAKWCKCTFHIHSYTLMHTHALVQIPELCCGFSFSLPSFSCCNCENSTFLCLVPRLGLSCWGEVVGYVHVLTCRLLITEVFLSHHLLRVMLRPNELVWCALTKHCCLAEKLWCQLKAITFVECLTPSWPQLQNKYVNPLVWVCKTMSSKSCLWVVHLWFQGTKLGHP